jgi:pimeloyl-ACP methyl ester carboxylesterase
MSRGLQGILYSVAGGRARILAVEKPGVEFLDDHPDDADVSACRPEFRVAFTLDRWATTIADAIQAAQKLPGVDASKTLVIGHSEGGIVAMRVSNVSPRVTHAASLSGGGPVYLFHLAEFMRSRQLDAEKEVYACWSDILKDPDSATKFCWGQTYRQWSSFMKTSVIAEALKSHALLYFAHGTADTQQSIAGFDVLRAELAAKQRDAVFERIEGADHALDLPSQKVPEGLEAVFGRVVNWFLGDVTK